MFQPSPNNTLPAPQIHIDGTQLKSVDEFTYLGSCLSKSANLDLEISRRLAKASSSFGRLWTRVWQERGIQVQTKISVYKAVVMSALLYGCESWTLYSRHIKQLDQFHLRCLRRIMNISWQDRITNTEVLRRADLYGIEAYVKKNQLRWAGHIVRMADSRLPKQIFFSELCQGERSRGRPTLRFKDTLKASLKCFNIDDTSWQALATDRNAWRAAIRNGAKSFEAGRLNLIETRRATRKLKQSKPLNPHSAIKCTVCGRLCASQFGLRSHMKIH